MGVLHGNASLIKWTCLDNIEDILITTCPRDPRVKGQFFHQTTFSVGLSRVKNFIQDVQKLIELEPKSMCGLELYNGILMRYVKVSSAYLGKQEDAIDFDITYYRSKKTHDPEALWRHTWRGGATCFVQVWTITHPARSYHFRSSSPSPSSISPSQSSFFTSIILLTEIASVTIHHFHHHHHHHHSSTTKPVNYHELKFSQLHESGDQLPWTNFEINFPITI